MLNAVVNTWLAHKVVGANPRHGASVYGVCMFSIVLSGHIRPETHMLNTLVTLVERKVVKFVSVAP